MAIHTKQRLLEARELLKVKQYNKARELLKGINHPKAREWLAKLDKHSRKRRENPRLLFLINAAAVIGAIIFILFVVLAHPPT